MLLTPGMLPTDEARRAAGEEAKRFMRDPAYVAAHDYIKNLAMSKLATVDPTDADAIREAQATLRAITGLHNMLAIAANAAREIPSPETDHADNRIWGTA